MGRTKEEGGEFRNALYQAWEEGRRSLSDHPWAVVALALTLTILVSLHVVSVFPSLATVEASAPYQVYYYAHAPLSLGLILLAAYGLAPLVAAVAGFWFMVLHIPSAILLYPEALFPIGGHIVEAAVGVFGIWLIWLLRRAHWEVEQRLREIRALAAQQVSLLNERIELMDKASGQEQRLAQFYQLLIVATRPRQL